MKMNVVFVTVALLWLAAGCGGSRASDTVGVEKSRAPEDPLKTILVAEDTRTAGPDLEALARSGDYLIRGRVATALGRIGDSSSVPLLLGLLEDRHPEVRESAVFALGKLGSGGGEAAYDALAGLVESDDSLDVRLRALDALCRVDSRCVRMLPRLFEDEEAAVRAGALRAYGMAGSRGAALESGWARSVEERLADGDEAVRFNAAFALYRAVEDPAQSSVSTSLAKTAFEDESVRVRAFALRALAKRGGLSDANLKKALESSHREVVWAAVMSLELLGDRRCDGAKTAVEKILEGLRSRRTDEAVSSMRVALETLVTCGESREMGLVVEELMKEPKTAGEALVKCLARDLAGKDDLALIACDPGRPHVGKRIVARRLGESRSPRGLGILEEMTSDPDLRLALAAVEALGRYDSAAGKEALIHLVGAKRPLVSAAALDQVTANPEIVAEDEEFSSKLRGAMAEMISRYAGREDVFAPHISAAAALGAMGGDEAAGLLEKLAGDERPCVRAAAESALSKLLVSAPKSLAAVSPTRPVDVDAVRAMDGQDYLARINTTRGAVLVRLMPDAAPATVLSFVELARSGFFDDTDIHRVVPNFVVQMGDSTGTGYGDPGYALRCEVSPILFERGVVGMAHAGKDTGGSQFFITLMEQPHLEGDYTVFGRVEAGMENVDLLEKGDKVLTVRIEGGD